MRRFLTVPLSHGLLEDMAGVLKPGEARIWWLGQAGFAVKTSGCFFLIDPYLSDSLAKKYAGKEFDHKRMSPVPVLPEEIIGLDAVFVTHRHTDHMDPETLIPLAASNPGCTFVIPRAERARALEIGLPENNLMLVNAGESFRPPGGIIAGAVPSAHEELTVNDAGEHNFLGYVIRVSCGAGCEGLCIYHSGDCVPYPGLVSELAEARRALDVSQIDAALLPVNGRDEYRKARNIPGNFTFREAVSLCKEEEIPRMFAHHFGMFAFNTANPKELVEACGKIEFPEVIVCSLSVRYMISSTS